VCEDRNVTEAEETSAPDAPHRPPDGDRFMGMAAGAIVVAMMCILVSALIVALASDFTPGPDVWKAQVRLMSVSGSGSVGGILVALGLLVALGMARFGEQTTSMVVAVVGMSLWLGLLMLLNIYVDVTSIGSADAAIATVLGEIAALAMLAVAGYWGVAMAGSKRT
jgi:hypothetical protein